MSSLVRRIQLRILAGITDEDAYREHRRKLKADPKWGRPLLKSGRAPRALRRSKKSQAWLAKRSADRKAQA